MNAVICNRGRLKMLQCATTGCHQGLMCHFAHDFVLRRLPAGPARVNLLYLIDSCLKQQNQMRASGKAMHSQVRSNTALPRLCAMGAVACCLSEPARESSRLLAIVAGSLSATIEPCMELSPQQQWHLQRNFDTVLVNCVRHMGRAGPLVRRKQQQQQGLYSSLGACLYQ